MAVDDYGALDATALAALVRSGAVHARELVEHAIGRAEALNPALNVIVHTQFDRAREDCGRVDLDAPFAGVPFLFKDYGAWEAGEPYRMGVRTLRDLDHRPRTDSAMATRIRSAGFIPIGRTNTPELAAMGTTEPELWGATHNPWHLGRSPGGSSGGSAAAVAARIVPAAHATDISGSIRIPAAMCGLVGLKPTRGRVVTSGVDTPVGMGVEGVVTRSVRDTAAIVSWLSRRSAWWPAPNWDTPLEPDRRLPPLRVGLWTDAFNGLPVDAGCRAAAEDVAHLLADLGHRVEVAAPPELSDDELWDLAKLCLSVVVADEATSWTREIGRSLGEDDLEPRTWTMVTAGRDVTGPQLHAALARLHDIADAAQAWWDAFDILLTPTTAGPPMPLGDYLDGYVSGRGSAFTRPINVTGQPAMSVPMGWPDDGLPRGVQLVGRYGDDHVVVALASQLERARPWIDRLPPSIG
jgi:amidase